MSGEVNDVAREVKLDVAPGILVGWSREHSRRMIVKIVHRKDWRGREAACSFDVASWSRGGEEREKGQDGGGELHSGV